MTLAFTLSMPGVGSWNRKWSGEEKRYVITRDLGNSKKATAKGEELCRAAYFTYDFGDGWRAGVYITSVTPAEIRVIRKHSAGFCGYDWMVDEILTHGRILTLAERHGKREVA